MFNPSFASPDKSDDTARNAVKFAYHHNYNKITIVNLLPIRMSDAKVVGKYYNTDFKKLKKDSIDKESLDLLPKEVVIAWGKLPENIELPKQKLEDEYEKNIIPNLYEKLWNKNEEKMNENAKNIEKIAVTDTYTVVSKVKEMFKELVKHKSFVFNKLFSIQKHNKQEVVTAFSGLLELSRRSKVETDQEELFGDINVKRRK